MVMPKFLNRALEKPGITFFKAVKAKIENRRMKNICQIIGNPYYGNMYCHSKDINSICGVFKGGIQK